MASEPLLRDWREAGRPPLPRSAGAMSDRARARPPALRPPALRDWKLAERHHRHKLTLAYLGESEMAGPPFLVSYRQLSRRELTLEVLLSSYPAGRAALYADADGVPLPEPQVLSPSPFSPAPAAGRFSLPATPTLGVQAGLQPPQPRFARLPSALLLGRRVEQLVGGFIRTRDVRALDPAFSRELTDLGALGGVAGGGVGGGSIGVGVPQPTSPAQSLILVRCGAIIIRLFHVRAVIVHDGLYIVLDPNPRAADPSDADTVRSVALRLKASTQEDRLGAPDVVAVRDRSDPGRELSEHEDGRGPGAPPACGGREGGSLVPSARSGAHSRSSAEESDTDSPVLVGCSQIGSAAGPERAPEPRAGAGAGAGARAAFSLPPSRLRHETPSSAGLPVNGAAAAAGAGGHGERGGGAAAPPAVAPPAAAAAAAPSAAPADADGAPPPPPPMQEPNGGGGEEGAYAGLPPFPLRALESVFDVVVDDLKAQLSRLKEEAHGALHALRLAVADMFGGIDDSLSFEVVRSLRERVRALTVSVRGAARAVAEVLDDDVQMAFIYLKKVHHAPEAYEQDPNFRSQHEEVELLFESYLNAFSSLQAALETVEYSIDSSERFVAQRLSSQRNGLLRMDVTFTVITAAISLCSFVTGMFGMNLSSGLEEQLEPWLFIIVSLFTGAVIVATTLMMVRAPHLVYSLRLTGQRRPGGVTAEQLASRLPSLRMFPLAADLFSSAPSAQPLGAASVHSAASSH